MARDTDWVPGGDGEAVVWRGGPRVRRILPTAARSAVLALVFVIVALVGPRYAPTVPALTLRSGALALAVLSLAPVLLGYLRTVNTHYVLTERNVYEKSGVWSTTVTRVGVGNVQNTRLEKDLWGNLFDYGTVAVSTAGSRGADLAFTDLDDPETFRDELRCLTSQHRSSGADGESGTGTTDPAVADTLLDEARAMRETAERIEAAVTDG